MSDVIEQIKALQTECDKYKQAWIATKEVADHQSDSRITPEGPYYTRHNQWAWITTKDENYASGYILGDQGNLHRYNWYVSKTNKGMPYIAEADAPSGRDLHVKPVKDPYYWSSAANTNINAKDRLQ